MHALLLHTGIRSISGSHWTFKQLIFSANLSSALDAISHSKWVPSVERMLGVQNLAFMPITLETACSILETRNLLTCRSCLRLEVLKTYIFNPQLTSQTNNVEYLTEAKDGAESRRCRVHVQKETPDGMVDGDCDEVAPNGFAGNCRQDFNLL